MVFFTCSHCGESVKKAAVAKHYQTKCGKKEPFLTCIDCLKDFRGTEYEGHTKCVTEEEKYSAKGSGRKQPQGKGEKKQQVWQECIQTLLKKPSLKSDEREFIKAIIKYENVPRKKSRFINFLSNAFKTYANKTELVDRVWVEMEAVFKELSGSLNEVQKQQQQKVQSEQQQQQKPQKQESKNAAKKSTQKPEEPTAKKDKKRKRQADEGKVAEGGDSGKSEENQKKKKQKQMEEKPAVGNDDALMSEDKENEQERKNRKRKADEDGQTEQNDSVPDEAEPGKKKKKKKHDKPAENQVTETPAQKPAEESKNKKKNKKPKAEGEQAPKVNNSAPTGAGDSVAVKKEKKAKKSENKENEKAAPVKNAVANNAQGEAEKPAAKKKKPGAGAATPAAKAESGGEESKQEMQFDWKATILQVLNQDGKNSRIQLQKLQKKVLKLHCQVLNCEPSEKKEKRFMKKLKEMSEVVLEKDFVVLKS